MRALSWFAINRAADVYEDNMMVGSMAADTKILPTVQVSDGRDLRGTGKLYSNVYRDHMTMPRVAFYDKGSVHTAVTLSGGYPELGARTIFSTGCPRPGCRRSVTEWLPDGIELMRGPVMRRSLQWKSRSWRIQPVTASHQKAESDVEGRFHPALRHRRPTRRNGGSLTRTSGFVDRYQMLERA